MVAAICQRLRTIPSCITSAGSRISSQIARSLPLDLSRQVARGVSVRARKQRNASVRQLAIRGRFGSQVSSMSLGFVGRLGPCSSEWPHVLKLFLRRLQPLAQALDVFIVRFVLLLVHFQQRPQDFDAMLFLRHTLSVFKLAYNSTVSGCFHRFTGFYIYAWLENVVLGVEESGWAFRDFSSLTTHFRPSIVCG